MDWTVPILSLKGPGQTGMIVHSTEQRKESSGYWGLQMAREKQSLFDLAHSCSSISKEKDILYQITMDYPYICVLCMLTVFLDFGNPLG